MTGKLLAYRYQLLHTIGQGGMGTVYHALDMLTENVVALKKIGIPTTNLSFTKHDPHEQERIALAREFRMLATLRHPNIVSVLDYGFDEFLQPYYTMELLYSPRDALTVARERDTKGKVEILIEIFQALIYLHRHSIIHRDLKPGNVLVEGDGRVKVVDFGLAMEQRDPTERSRVVGTTAYIAPEMFQGKVVTSASDLYAAGIMAYEFFVGHHPFHGLSVARLIASTVSISPDMQPVEEAAGTEIAGVIGRLLMKNPEDRYASARETMVALCEAAGVPLPVESRLVRESFLQAAPFVGRREELKQLEDALEQAMQGSGSAWLVGGESGVGKSRLLDEVRIRGMVSGALVLNMQGMDDGGLPYQLWRETLRRLLVFARVSDAEASILKEVVTDIHTLIGRAVRDVPEDSPDEDRQRLVLTVAGLFLQQRQPVLLLVDDVHWATESLAVLKYLSSIVQSLPLLIVGSYRSDEAPYFYGGLPDMRPMSLERLSETEVTELSRAILGDVGSEPGLIDLLHTQTEGNPFLVVEVLRTLADTTGRLEDIGRMTLPLEVFAPGMQAVTERRVSRLPVDYQPVLRLAALIGRQIDLDLLRAAYSSIDYDDWLMQCANASLIDVVDDSWRFAHDKLRQGMLRSLDNAALMKLHGQAAEAVEKVYGDTPEHAAMLAHYWREAGDIVKANYYTSRVRALPATVNSPDISRDIPTNS